MRRRALTWFALLLFGTTGGILTYSLSSAQQGEFVLPTTKVGPTVGRPQPSPRLLPPSVTQDPAPVAGAPLVAPTPAPSVQPAAFVAPMSERSTPAARNAPLAKYGDLEHQPALTRQMILSSQRGIEWLSRYNQQSGRFVPGFLPALNAPMDGDHFLRQAAATVALARAAAFTGDERHAIRATHAVLGLLTETKEEPKGIRYPALPSVVCNRLAASGMLVLAIHELPTPSPELLDRAEELCAFIRSRQQADGSLQYGDTPEATAADPAGVRAHPGPALHAVAVSQKRRPAAWKPELVRKAMPYYRQVFKQSPHPTFVPSQTAAFAEAFMQTKDATFASFVFEMNDWLVQLQYAQLDPRRQTWFGGFQSYEGGQIVATPPDFQTALYAQSLAEACRVTRQIPDLDRYNRYRTSLVRSLQFLTTLQYTDEACQHFAAHYRPAVVGGFHPSHQDGNLRVEDTAQSVSAMLQFFNCGTAE